MQFPGTMTDLVSGAWMVSGASVLQNGITIKNGYACDLDKLEEGSRLGIMRKSGGSLHFFVNGQDCGAAATSVPSGTDFVRYFKKSTVCGERHGRLMVMHWPLD